MAAKKEDKIVSTQRQSLRSAQYSSSTRIRFNQKEFDMRNSNTTWKPEVVENMIISMDAEMANGATKTDASELVGKEIGRSGEAVRKRYNMENKKKKTNDNDVIIQSMLYHKQYYENHPQYIYR